MSNLLTIKFHLEKIQSILRIEIPAYLLLSLSFFTGIGFFILKIVILLFSPYMVFVLFRLKKFGWITTFCLIVVLPYIFSFIKFSDATLTLLINLFPLLTFLIFTFLLKMVIPDWLEEINAKVFRNQSLLKKISNFNKD